MKQLANVLTKDTYDPALTIEEFEAISFSYIVANASVLMKVRGSPRTTGGEGSYGAEQLITPEKNTIPYVNGAQFKSAVAGAPARVIASLFGPNDPQIGTGIPFLQTLLASGGVGAIAAAYKEFAGSVTLAGATEATATLIVVADSVTVDGLTPIKVEFFAPRLNTNGVQRALVVLYQDGASIGVLGDFEPAGTGSASGIVAVKLERTFVPTSGAHVYSIRGYSTASTAIVDAGTGGSGNYMPGFIRISTAT